jgi:hypothetical protein
VPRPLALAVLGLLVIGATACGVAQGTDPGIPDPPIAGDCPPGVDRCGDDAIVVDEPWDESVFEENRLRARELLGLPEDALPDDVRVARRGDDHMALTMDLQPGRLNVELDERGNGFEVVLVTLETPDGSEEFTLDEG